MTGPGRDAGARRDLPRAQVNGERFWANLNELGQIGRGERGISRLAFASTDMEGRRWLLRKMEHAGLEAWMDQVGNVFGRLEPGIPRHEPLPGWKGQPAILMGSHIDTVPEGGMFDGALGVLAGLECLQTVRDAGLALEHPLELAAFANEEGSRIVPGTFGSRAFSLGIPESEWNRVSLVLKEAGLGGPAAREAPAPSFRPEEHLCYLELHIEQGGVLDQAGEDIGVVQGIVCISPFNVTFMGEANHAGTTPMGQRKDALLGAAELVLAVPECVKRLGSADTAGTCGQIRVRPGGRNVIPGEAEISVEVRDLDQAIASRVVAAIKDEAQAVASRRGLGVEISRTSLNPGAAMDARIQDVIEACARDLGLATRRLPSGAGHDAMNLAKHVPTGMIFVPSRGGISHSPKECTSKGQCVAGASVLLRTVLALDAGAYAR